MNKKNSIYAKVMTMAKRRGYIWGPTPEIFGGLSGFYDLGPLGRRLKENISNFIRNKLWKLGFWEVESPTIAPEIVWRASGHLEGFTDPIVQCKSCGVVYRADKLILDKFPELEIHEKDYESLTAIIREKNIRCPKCNSEFGDVGPYNLMVKTTIGLNTIAYLRPETATTTYLLFPRLLSFFRNKLPIKVFQLGKAYRNEISPRQGLLRLREFTQLEAQVFILESDEYTFPDFAEVRDTKVPILSTDMQTEGISTPQKMSFGKMINEGIVKKEAYAWTLWVGYYILGDLGFDDKRIRMRQHRPDERAHYALDAWDIEIFTDEFGWVEVCGVHDRGNYDLSRHQKFSKTSMEVFVGKNKVIPHVLEIAFGIERPLYCLLEQSFKEDKIRTWLKLPPFLAPIQVGIFPLMKKDNLPEVAFRIYKELISEGYYAIYDETGSIGKRYRRQDEIGTPFAITIDYQTLEDNTVTLRDRDTMNQTRIKISEIKNILKKKIKQK